MDSTTLILLLAVGNACLCVSLFFFGFAPPRSSLMSLWMRGKAVQAVAWVLLFCANQIPGAVFFLFGHGLLFLGLVLEVGAMSEAGAYPQWRKPLYSFWFVYVLLSVLELRLVDAKVGTAGMVPGMLCILLWLEGWVFLRLQGAPSPLRRFVGFSTLGLAIAIALRSLLAWYGADSRLQTIFYVALYLHVLINGFGFLLLAREQQQDELSRLALLDPLTNAPNQRGFFNALAPWLALARRPGNQTALIMLDLDHFKRINDNYGHPIGDQVLKAVVAIGQSQLRDSDLIGRLGGEEFAVLLPRTNAVDAMMVAERMRQAIMAMQIKAEKAVLSVTASFGVTTIRADDSMVSLIKRADEALSAAKNAGRNQVKEAAPTAQLMV
jgi:diguanylate cyclase (GGDEF)-like protein